MGYEKLFSPIQLRGLELKNRVVFPAMGTKMSGGGKEVTQKLIDYHAERAKGGNGLNIVEVSSVHAPSSPRGFLSIAEDHYIEGFQKLTDAIRKNGGKSAVQLWQGGTAVASDPNAMIVVPSDMTLPQTEFTLPGAKTETIWEIIEAYGKAAKRAVEAGFDTMELHAAHSYSLHTFLSPAFNRREDEFGGSFENRTRYLLETIRQIRKNIPEQMPLLMRIDAKDDNLEKGLTIEEIIEICKLAKTEGVDVLDVSRGNMFSAAIKYEVPPVDVAKGFNVDNAAKIRKETEMTTIAVGRINRPDQAETILQEDKADMVVMGRAQLADAQFCNKAKEGKDDAIVYCVGCN
ncbi:MAG TPA: NADH oxidase, partial [Eubacteriaceae bacterium]|nr:NADH oxidase [Eubacteriaceae bacterium]